jgi:hypothetical protein
VTESIQKVHVGLPLAELPREHVVQFLEKRLRPSDGVLADAVLPQIGTSAQGDERLHQDVRIEGQPHETRVNTSSSV